MELEKYKLYTCEDIIKKIHKDYDEIITDVNDDKRIMEYSITLIENEYRVYHYLNSYTIVLSMGDLN